MLLASDECLGVYQDESVLAALQLSLLPVARLSLLRVTLPFSPCPATCYLPVEASPSFVLLPSIRVFPPPTWWPNTNRRHHITHHTFSQWPHHLLDEDFFQNLSKPPPTAPSGHTAKNLPDAKASHAKQHLINHLQKPQTLSQNLAASSRNLLKRVADLLVGREPLPSQKELSTPRIVRPAIQGVLSRTST